MNIPLQTIKIPSKCPSKSPCCSTPFISALHQAPRRVVGILIRLEDTWSQAEGIRRLPEAGKRGVEMVSYILVHRTRKMVISIGKIKTNIYNMEVCYVHIVHYKPSICGYPIYGNPYDPIMILIRWIWENTGETNTCHMWDYRKCCCQLLYDCWVITLLSRYNIYHKA